MTYNAHTIRKELKKRRILQLLAENQVLSIGLLMHTLGLSYATIMRYLNLLEEEDLIQIEREGEELVVRIKRNWEEIFSDSGSRK